MTATQRLAMGSPRTALSPLRSSMDHSSSIKYDHSLSHDPSRYQKKDKEIKEKEKTMDILKMLQHHMQQKNCSAIDTVHMFHAFDEQGVLGKTHAGFGDKSLDASELKVGLNRLLGTTTIFFFLILMSRHREMMILF